MNLLYLSFRLVLVVMILNVVIFYILGFSLILFTILIISGIIFFLCRKKRSLNINKDKENGIIFAPITGVIKNITTINQTQVVHVKRSFFEEWGVYMPSCASIDHVIDYTGSKKLFLSNIEEYPTRARKKISFSSKMGVFELCFLEHPLASFDCWVESGDYGYSASRIGVQRGPVDMLLFLPKEFSIVMNRGELMESGKSILAANTAVHL